MSSLNGYQESDTTVAKDGGNSGWELCKENIQPLSSGRKMALLNQSLPRLENSLGVSFRGGSSALQTTGDQEIMVNIQNFEQEIEEYAENDPLSVWIRYISYFEQKCLCSGKYQGRYNEVLTKCVRTFVMDNKCNNDKRFVEIFIKSFANIARERRVAVFHNSLNQGVGLGVSEMYIQIAEDYEALQKFTLVSEILELGKKNNAQPMKYLDEFLVNFQVRVAQSVSRSLRSEADKSDYRIFGASVPLVGPQKDAQNIRIGLAKADPSKARPTINPKENEPKKTEVYYQIQAGDGTTQPIRKNCSNPVKDIESIKDNLGKENFQEPSKWNKPEGVLLSTVTVPTPVVEKIQIYEDSNIQVVPDFITERKARKTPRPALNERKIDSDEAKEIVATAESGSLPVISRKSQTFLIPSATNAPVAEKCQNPDLPSKIMEKCQNPDLPSKIMEKCQNPDLPSKIMEKCQNPDLPSKIMVMEKFQNPDQQPSKVMNPAGSIADLKPNQRMKCRIRDLWLDGKEVTFEHFRVAEWKKRHAERNPSTLPQNAALKSMEIENEQLRLRIIDLEEKLKQTEMQAAMERKNHAREIESLIQQRAFVQDVREQVAPTPVNDKENIVVKPLFQIYQDTEERVKPAAFTLFGQGLGVDETEAILRKQANIEPDFDVSNLTRALSTQPRPMHNSTPERIRQEETTRNLRTVTADPIPIQNNMIPYQMAKINFNQSMHVGHNLSTIQENSKESRASTTSSSGSNANTGASTFSATANYTKSAQRNSAKSQLGISGMPPPTTQMLHFSQDWN